MPRPAVAPDLKRLPISINPRAISVAEGVRAGLSVAVIIAASEYIQFPALREAALAALLTCICDPGGPIRRRVPVLLSFTLIGAAVMSGCGLLRGFGPEAAVAIGVIGLFFGSFASVYGQAPQQLGTLLNVVLILSLDRAIPDLPEAASRAAAFIGGGLWATLLTMVIWRTYPFLPARRAVAETYRQLSELVRDLYNLVLSSTITSANWEAHARISRRGVREAIETARTVVFDTLRARGASSNRAAQSLIRLETADQLFGSLIALSDLLEHETTSERRAAARIMRRLRPLLLVLGRVIVTDEPDAHTRIERAIDSIVEDSARLAPDSRLRKLMEPITERLRIAHTRRCRRILTQWSIPLEGLFRPGSGSWGRYRPMQPGSRPRCATPCGSPLPLLLRWRSP